MPETAEQNQNLQISPTLVAIPSTPREFIPREGFGVAHSALDLSTHVPMPVELYARIQARAAELDPEAIQPSAIATLHKETINVSNERILAGMVSSAGLRPVPDSDEGYFADDSRDNVMSAFMFDRQLPGRVLRKLSAPSPTALYANTDSAIAHILPALEVMEDSHNVNIQGRKQDVILLPSLGYPLIHWGVFSEEMVSGDTNGELKPYDVDLADLLDAQAAKAEISKSIFDLSVIPTNVKAVYLEFPNNLVNVSQADVIALIAANSHVQFVIDIASDDFYAAHSDQLNMATLVNLFPYNLTVLDTTSKRLGKSMGVFVTASVPVAGQLRRQMERDPFADEMLVEADLSQQTQRELVAAMQMQGEIRSEYISQIVSNYHKLRQELTTSIPALVPELGPESGIDLGELFVGSAEDGRHNLILNLNPLLALLPHIEGEESLGAKLLELLANPAPDSEVTAIIGKSAKYYGGKRDQAMLENMIYLAVPSKVAQYQELTAAILNALKKLLS